MWSAPCVWCHPGHWGLVAIEPAGWCPGPSVRSGCPAAGRSCLVTHPCWVSLFSSCASLSLIFTVSGNFNSHMYLSSDCRGCEGIQEWWPEQHCSFKASGRAHSHSDTPSREAPALHWLASSWLCFTSGCLKIVIFLGPSKIWVSSPNPSTYEFGKLRNSSEFVSLDGGSWFSQDCASCPSVIMNSTHFPSLKHPGLDNPFTGEVAIVPPS